MKRLRTLTLAAIVAGCLLRLTHLGAPLTADEGYTLHAYASYPCSVIVSIYDAANNHVLLSLILHAIDACWPKKLILTLANPWPLQMPSLVGAMASLWLLGSIAATLAGPVASLFAVVALALSYWHLMYSHMLRGYSLSTALELTALWLAIKALRRRQAWCWIAAAVACACAHYTVPTNVVFTAALAASLPWLAGPPRPQPAKGKARGKTRATERQPFSWAWPVSAGTICAILTLGAYWSILDQLRKASTSAMTGWLDAVTQTPSRAGSSLAVLGYSGPWVWSFAVIALLGLAATFRGGRRTRTAGRVVAAYVIVPMVIFSLQRVVPMSRIYLPALPLWCLAFGLAVRAAAARFSRVLSSHAARRLVTPGLALAAVVAFSTQVGPYLRWNRGVDPRLALVAVAPTVRDSDDFRVIPTTTGDDLRFGALDWDYYGFSAHIDPYYNLIFGKDSSYQARARYIVLAEDEFKARQALALSGVDEVMRGALRETGRSGRLRIFESVRDASVLARYHAAAVNPLAAPPLRAAALTGLGIASLATGDFPSARGLLEKALQISPDDEKIRYQLGRAYYLSFDDTKAASEFEWVVSHDTQNASAPFYLADSLGQLGRPQDALKWYQWYFEPDRPADGWIWKSNCKIGISAIQAGKGAVNLGPGDAADWVRAANGFYNKGAYERALRAMAYFIHLKPSNERIVGLASLFAMNHQYAAAASLLRLLLAHGGYPSWHVQLATILKNNGDFGGARSEIDQVLAVKPDDKDALALAAELRRL